MLNVGAPVEENLTASRDSLYFLSVAMLIYEKIKIDFLFKT